MRPIILSNPNLDARGRRLGAALAAVLVPDNAPVVQLVRRWLDSWSGVGLVLAGMAHQDYDVQLTAYAARDWRATFYPVGIAHSIVAGSAYEPTPWRAVQWAAWAVLGRQ
jgi:hypothetical protein